MFNIDVGYFALFYLDRFAKNAVNLKMECSTFLWVTLKVCEFVVALLASHESAGTA